MKTRYLKSKSKFHILPVWCLPHLKFSATFYPKAVTLCQVQPSIIICANLERLGPLVRLTWLVTSIPTRKRKPVGSVLPTHTTWPPNQQPRPCGVTSECCRRALSRVAAPPCRCLLISSPPCSLTEWIWLDHTTKQVQSTGLRWVCGLCWWARKQV